MGGRGVQRGEDFLGGLADHLAIERVRAQVEIARPLKSTRRADGEKLEHAFLLPGAEYPPPGEVIQIHRPGSPVIEAEKYLKTTAGFGLNDFHGLKILHALHAVELGW